MPSTPPRFVPILVGIGAFLALGAGEAKPPAAKQIEALIQAQAKAWNKGDLDGFLAPYWDDKRLTFFSGGDVRRGLKEVAARYHKNYKAEGKEMGRLTFSDLDVTPLGADAALVRGRWKVVMKKEALSGLFTLLMRKRGGKWRIVHDHTSRAEKKP